MSRASAHKTDDAPCPVVIGHLHTQIRTRSHRPVDRFFEGFHSAGVHETLIILPYDAMNSGPGGLLSRFPITFSAELPTMASATALANRRRPSRSFRKFASWAYR